jgi:hypothetical protein
MADQTMTLLLSGRETPDCACLAAQQMGTKVLWTNVPRRPGREYVFQRGFRFTYNGIDDMRPAA